ncbi:SulA-like leucine-rich domain-containing protein [Marinobacter qingdaonensis]|jgi:cell division inhibitor SulA|uniref:SulA-like leucine-rich domain-containing protein n=1 Tax=Marinobacter qingdaonensis TaxID=3108486 RepID=A0ABU5P0C9_9GAMM|nr:SulA-like leucine-rich domain-containing protein [Marinobacter sp. ASW11-75]MEA1081510.1 SulA-like leucine-rich domain-containing protein [Marinobacter sp. ASW11-75]MEE2764757.1 SulA-like leucine-rich domain-containing protein [Pseudomonadota bacterium]
MEQMSFNQNLAYQQSALSRAVPVSAGGERRSVIRTRPKPAQREPAVAGNVTEIILPEGQVENFQLLLPMLTQLNQEKRWLAWIDPPQALVSKWQKMHGIVAGELLVLRSTPDHSAQELAERALSAGTCHAVVMWTRKLGRPAFDALQRASAAGNSHGVILRQR